MYIHHLIYSSMRKNYILLFLLLTSSVALGQQTLSGGPLKPEQALMDIRHYTVSLDVSPESSSFNGFTEIDLILSGSSAVLIFDLDQVFTVSKIMVNGKKEAFTHSDGLIRINSGSSFGAGKHKVRIDYGGKPPIAARPPWDGGIQWAKDSLGRNWIAMSCQADGADIFFPCKDHPGDEPDEGADLIITVPKGLVAAGPGVLVKSSNKGKKSTYHWKTNYSIANYSILFNVGSYVVEKRPYKTALGNTVSMEFYVLDYNKPRAKYHLDLLERSAWMQEKYFGEFPFAKEKLAICETPHLGMEHQTLNAYGNKFKYVKVGDVDFDWLMHHEFGHEWWANKVSNKDWGHMWIQEGICTFGDALFFEDFGGRAAYIDRMKSTALATQNKFPIVRGDAVDSRVAYISDIYGKGAFFMHTLRWVIGDDIFFPAIKAFATDPRYTYVNTVMTDDLLNHFNAAAGQNLKPLFNLFLYTTDKLGIEVKQTGLKTYSVRLSNIDMPLPVEIQTSSGRKRITLSKKETLLQSDSAPVIDPDTYYLKKVSFE